MRGHGADGEHPAQHPPDVGQTAAQCWEPQPTTRLGVRDHVHVDRARVPHDARPDALAVGLPADQENPGPVAVLAVVAQQLKRLSRIGHRDVNVIHNWVDLQDCSPSASDRQRGPGPFRLLMVGSHTRRKGTHLLPTFVKALGPGFEVRWVGGTGHRTRIPGVIQLGRLSTGDLVYEYRGCDAVLSLSRYEGFGYTALEAMAVAKPFVGFAGSGLSEVVEDGRTALMAPLEDVDALAACCHRLRDDRGLRGRMGRSGRVRALARYGEEAALDAYLALYSRVLTAFASDVR